MTKRWREERKRDHYYKRAKKEDYRSRAAFKLLQINNKFNIIKLSNIVIDLGACPGGWSQVASEAAGDEGKVIAVDMKEMPAIQGVAFVKGNAMRERTRNELWDVLSEVKGLGPDHQDANREAKADVIVSDMAPNISGNYSIDHAKSIELAEIALDYADEFLRPGGNIVVKVFEGDMMQNYYNKIKIKFKISKRHAPKASRKSSSEVYIIGKGYKGSSLPRNSSQDTSL
jgi:23S rRNA (uridine2552-2'-O)-methyltransferase